eukprot:608943-Rhodomonas_salina.2
MGQPATHPRLLARVEQQPHSTQDPLGRGVLGADFGRKHKVGLRGRHSALARVLALVDRAL